MQITDQGSPNILWKREKGKREWERIREFRSASLHAGVQHFFFWIAADMELAEEDGIVRIRRRDFTKRRLPMCNSFWRPWNCYCEKFSSCNSTESPQIGRIQPPYYPAAHSHQHHHRHHSHVSLRHDCMKSVGGWRGVNAMVWVSMNFAASKNMRAFVWSGWQISWFDASQCAPLIKWKYVEVLLRCC